MISGNMVGAYSQLGKTFIITDADGNELTGVVVDQETIFTATDNDVREGFVYASDEGVSTGTKDIPIYRTQQGFFAIKSGNAFSLKLPKYDVYNYTQLQCMLAPFNTTIDDSCAVDKVVLNDGVYFTGSTDKISSVTKNSDTKSIDLNIVNDSDKTYFVYFFTYKEEE